MNYNQTLEFLFSSLVSYQEKGPEAYKPGLERITAFCKHLGNPQRNYFTIHVAGTNGKGSVSHMLASVLQQAGYRTGLYTSPHLRDFRERILVDGEMIPKQKVVNFVDKHYDCMKELGLSFFEMSTALAFDYFDQSDVEVAVIETGLGGRLDATNLIIPIVSVITNIGLDHMALLGDTLPKIAAEKAGIIKKSIPVIIGEADARQAVRKTEFRTDVIGSNTRLAGASLEMIDLPGRESRLRKALAPIQKDYDFIFIDCPPSLDLLTLNGLCACDSILIPVQCEYYALEGLSDLMGTLRAIKRRLNPSISVFGVLLTMYDGRTNFSNQVAEEVRRHFPGKVYANAIPRNVRLAEAPSHGLPVIAYDRSSRGAAAYLAVAEEIRRKDGSL